MTVEEVFNLCDGDEVIITWSGGNGPFRYQVKWWDDRPYAALPQDSDHLVDWIAWSRSDVRLIHQVARAC